MTHLYTRLKFGWTLADFSNFAISNSAAIVLGVSPKYYIDNLPKKNSINFGLLGALVVLPVLSYYLKFKDGIIYLLEIDQILMFHQIMTIPNHLKNRYHRNSFIVGSIRKLRDPCPSDLATNDVSLYGLMSFKI